MIVSECLIVILFYNFRLVYYYFCHDWNTERLLILTIIFLDLLCIHYRAKHWPSSEFRRTDKKLKDAFFFQSSLAASRLAKCRPRMYIWHLEMLPSTADNRTANVTCLMEILPAVGKNVALWFTSERRRILGSSYDILVSTA